MQTVETCPKPGTDRSSARAGAHGTSRGASPGTSGMQTSAAPGIERTHIQARQAVGRPTGATPPSQQLCRHDSCVSLELHSADVELHTHYPHANNSRAFCFGVLARQAMATPFLFSSTRQLSLATCVQTRMHLQQTIRQLDVQPEKLFPQILVLLGFCKGGRVECKGRSLVACRCFGCKFDHICACLAEHK